MSRRYNTTYGAGNMSFKQAIRKLRMLREWRGDPNWRPPERHSHPRREKRGQSKPR